MRSALIAGFLFWSVSAGAAGPDITAYTHFGLNVALGDDASGSLPHSESGFVFDFARLVLDQDFGKHLMVSVAVDATQDTVALDHAYGSFVGLPWGLTLNAGAFDTRIGYENMRDPHQRVFVDNPFFFESLFGLNEARSVGLDISIQPPVHSTWTLELVGGLYAAAGPGAHSFYGDEAVEVVGANDFVYHLAARNLWKLATMDFNWSLGALLGPNNTGRSNASNIFNTAILLTVNPENVKSGTQIELMVEAFLRRRQIPGGIVQDMSALAAFSVLFQPCWGIAARYEFMTGSDGQDRLPTFEDDRHSLLAQVTWRPIDYARLRLQGTVDMGGGLGSDGKSYGVLLHLETGVMGQ